MPLQGQMVLVSHTEADPGSGHTPVSWSGFFLSGDSEGRWGAAGTPPQPAPGASDPIPPLKFTTASTYPFLWVTTKTKEILTWWLLQRKVTYWVVFKEFQDKCNGTTVDTNKEVNARQGNIGSAGNAEEARCWIHHRDYGPSACKR